MATTQNALRRHLTERDVAPEACRAFDLVAHGPVYPEVEKPADFDPRDAEMRRALMARHLPLRDPVGAMEKRLAEDLAAAGHAVMNTVRWTPTIADEDWHPIRAAFMPAFPRLADLAEAGA